MRILLSCIMPALAGIIFSCSNPAKKPDFSKVATDFAQIQCRAIQLRELRFAIANDIRFTQDTLLKAKNNPDTVRLKSRLELLNTRKETTLRESLSIADSIKYKLDTLQKNFLNDTAAKRSFNETLNNILKKKGCI